MARKPFVVELYSPDLYSVTIATYHLSVALIGYLVGDVINKHSFQHHGEK
jgi:hypothetical protein